MKRADIKAEIANGTTEFAMARYDRTKGIDAPSNRVIIKSADPAARSIQGNWSSHLESKPTGVAVAYADDLGGYKAGTTKVVQPQQIVGTWVEYVERQEKVAKHKAEKHAQGVADAAAAKQVADALTEKFGVEVRVAKAFMGRYEIVLTMDAARKVVA